MVRDFIKSNHSFGRYGSRAVPIWKIQLKEETCNWNSWLILSTCHDIIYLVIPIFQQLECKAVWQERDNMERNEYITDEQVVKRTKAAYRLYQCRWDKKDIEMLRSWGSANCRTAERRTPCQHGWILLWDCNVHWQESETFAARKRKRIFYPVLLYTHIWPYDKYCACEVKSNRRRTWRPFRQDHQPIQQSVGFGKGCDSGQWHLSYIW